MTFGSFCSGIEGIGLGLERAGMVCKWQCEIDKFCLKVLRKHWPDVKKYNDLRKLTGHELEPVDLLCGGYPCQPFSQAGKRAGESDERHLWPEFRRIIRVLRPRYVLLENVSGHLSLGFGSVLRDLSRLGYDAEWRCFRASDFGASHLRKRVFIVAYRSGERGERWRDAGIMGCPEGAQSSEALQRERHGYSVDDSGNTLADDPLSRSRRLSESAGRHDAANTDGCGEDLGDSECSRRQTAGKRCDIDPGREPEAGRGVVADAGGGLIQEPRRGSQGRDGIGSAGALPVFAPGPSDPRWPAIIADYPWLAPSIRTFPSSRNIAKDLAKRRAECLPRRGRRAERKQLALEILLACTEGIAWEKEALARVRKLAHGISDSAHRDALSYADAQEWLGGLRNIERFDAAMQDRTKRLKALGNSVIPQIAEYIGRRIMKAANEERL